MSDVHKSAGFSARVPPCVEQTCHEYRGVVMPNAAPARLLRALQEFKVRPDDLFVITWPKSGTTWVQYIALLVQLGGDVTKMKRHVGLQVPFIDEVVDLENPETSRTYLEVAERRRSPRILRTHSPEGWLPRTLRPDNPSAKVIYVARNPKDAAVSYYHFCRYVRPYLPPYESWDIFFEELIAGRTPWGPWATHVSPWWRNRKHRNILFLKYEDIKRDLPGTVETIAHFMDIPLSKDTIQTIASLSTFDAMKKNPLANADTLFKGEIKENYNSFMRKGTVGDWKNYFSKDQNERFDDLYTRETIEPGLHFDFDPPSTSKL